MNDICFCNPNYNQTNIFGFGFQLHDIPKLKSNHALSLFSIPQINFAIIKLK